MFRNRDPGKSPKPTHRLFKLSSLSLLVPVLAAGIFAMFLISNPFISMGAWTESNRDITKELTGQAVQPVPQAEVPELSETIQPSVSEQEDQVANDTDNSEHQASTFTACDTNKKSAAETIYQTALRDEDKLHESKLNQIKLIGQLSEFTTENKRNELQVKTITDTLKNSLREAHCQS